MQIESVMIVVLILTTISWMVSVILAVVSAQHSRRTGEELNKKADDAATQAGIAAVAALDIGTKLDTIHQQTNSTMTELRETNKELRAQIERLVSDRNDRKADDVQKET